MLFSGLVTLACVLTANTVTSPNGLTISTQQGDVVGTLVSPTVRQFLGIPYAVAGRWTAPSSPPKRTAPLTTTSFSDSCLQALTPGNVEFLKLAGLSNYTFVPESENCLSVNIWTPSIQRKQGTAVMLWVYGGGFAFGTSNLVEYNGQNLVQDNDDVLIVTFNYRTNLFGQPNAPQLASQTNSQNFGLLDLDAAVQWMYNNIAAFGGDPARIVLFGQSAGAVAIDAYTYMHPQDTIVKGIIEQSGSLSGVVTPTNGTINPTAWNTVAVAVGCGTANNAAQLMCMEAVPFRQLENAAISTNSSFGPLVDNITVFADYETRAASGNFLKVPMFIGTAQSEGDIFAIAQEEQFTCSASKTSNDRVKAGVSTWRYQYQAIFPDISSRPDLRAYHSSEIPLVFGTYSVNPSPPPTNTEIALGKYVQGAWVAFARDPINGLRNYGWPTFDPSTASLCS